MCGIAGYWGEGTDKILEEMGESLAHRGPDESGQVQNNAVGLVHRRLSILDLSPTGQQPMCTKDGRVALIFNGEIYNYKELRNEYLHDVVFNGSSDTEVILRLYEKFGESFLEFIKGMFAIALYDQSKGKLLLARDHLGKKPLYWAQSNETLIFGSELKALRRHPLCPKKLNTLSVAQYLVYEYISAPATIYEGVYKLLPGTYLIYDGQCIEQKVFSKVDPIQGSYTENFESAKKELFSRIEESVKVRMVADVPVGVFLSGGLDSSAVAFFAQRATQNQIKTFSIGFKDQSFDESSYAREMARILGTDHYERIVGPEELLSVIHRLPRILDEPMADSSIIPTVLLSELASSKVKVVLGGDGADELFSGYDTFFAHRLGDLYEKIPQPIHRNIKKMVNAFPVSHTYMSFDFKAKKFLSGFDTTKARRNTYWLSAFTPEELPLVLNTDVDIEALLAPSDRHYMSDVNFSDSLQREYLHGFLAEDILVKTDRAGMAYGLEVRAPFLDVDLARFAIALDASYKRRGRRGKYILKEIMKGCLPDHIIERRKKGFNIPIGSWIKNELKEFFTETLLDGELVKSGLFKREGLAILLEAHIAGKADNRKKLWALLILALWMKEWHE